MVFTKQQVDEIYRKEHKRTIGRFEPVKKKGTGGHYDWYKICGNFKPSGEIDKKYNPEQFYEEGEVILGGIGEHFLYPDYQEGDIMDIRISPNPPKRLHNFIHGVYAGDYYQNLCDIKLDDEENTPEEIVNLFYKWKEYWLARRQEECDVYTKEKDEREKREPWDLREDVMNKAINIEKKIWEYYVMDNYNGVLWPDFVFWPSEEDKKLFNDESFVKDFITDFRNARNAWLEEVKRQESIPGYLPENFEEENFRRFSNHYILGDLNWDKEEMNDGVKNILNIIEEGAKQIGI